MVRGDLNNIFLNYYYIFWCLAYFKTPLYSMRHRFRDSLGGLKEGLEDFGPRVCPTPDFNSDYNRKPTLRATKTT